MMKERNRSSDDCRKDLVLESSNNSTTSSGNGGKEKTWKWKTLRYAFIVIWIITTMGRKLDFKYTIITEETIIDSSPVATTTSSSSSSPTTTQNIMHDSRNETESVSNTTTTTTTTTTNATSFTGSRITYYDHDMKLYENVCIVHEDRKFINFRYYTNTADPEIAKQHSFDQSVKTYQDVFAVNPPFQYSLEQWYEDSANGKRVFEGETVWTMEIYNNPGHCLSDMMLPLVLDQFHRSTNSDKQKVPFYDYFLMGRPKRFWDSVADENWCFTMMRAAGLLKHVSKGLVSMEDSTKCFRRLYVPHVAGFRYPLNENEDPDQRNAFQKIATVTAFKKKIAINYPRAALQQLRSNIAQFFNLTIEPWPERSNDAQSETNILLHVRGKKQRRQLFNSEELKHSLEQQYHANVTLLSDAWKPLSIADQLKMYNSYQYIITVHGAHLSNAIVARPNTKLIELFCSIPADALPDPLLTERNASTAYEDWYGFSALGGWFATPFRRMGYEYFEAGQKKCTNEHKNFMVDKYKRGWDMYADLNTTLPLIRNRFGLKPRK